MGLFSFFQGSSENAGKKIEEKDPLQTLKSFIGTSPASQYTFDSERDSPRSTICRPSDSTDGKECITIEMNSKKLFATMQVIFRLLLCAARRSYADIYGMYAATQIVISTRNLRTCVLRNGTTVEGLEENM
ncbi:hypothetical protein EV421DRAFT_323534 [Armillaria borealis]|uniref:Uncharacterized protein n=1 Tax=Armillaria borealis TaxID=47425 RepID=A0AA39JMX0_9AGAR|nr:hypothetical protein EV421DRAFT_323534 [Armillaria borealis]